MNQIINKAGDNIKIRLLIIIFMIIVLCCFICARYFHVDSQIIKVAVKKADINGDNYIFCQRTSVTGFDWIMKEDSQGNKANEYCNIIGLDPFTELNLRHDFIFAQNTYVFYVEERIEYYSEEMEEICVEYIISGWDILYPIKHGGAFDIFKSGKYITQNDTM